MPATHVARGWQFPSVTSHPLDSSPRPSQPTIEASTPSPEPTRPPTTPATPSARSVDGKMRGDALDPDAANPRAGVEPAEVRRVVEPRDTPSAAADDHRPEPILGEETFASAPATVSITTSYRVRGFFRARPARAPTPAASSPGALSSLRRYLRVRKRRDRLFLHPLRKSSRRGHGRRHGRSTARSGSRASQERR